MAQKPSTQSILSTYSLSEILELIREKAAMDYQDTVNNLQDQIRQISSNLGGSISQESKQTITKAKSPKPTKSRTRAKNKQPVGDMILGVLSSTPMSIGTILSAIQAKGFKTSSKNPRQIISLQLLKLSKDKKIKKAERGMYVLVSNSTGKKTGSSKKSKSKNVKKTKTK